MRASSAFPHGGAGDAQAGELSLADRFRRHAASLAASDRSPLYVTMMTAAAEDIDAGGAVAEVFADVAVPPGSVPQLRLLAALHGLVLRGRAPDLGRFYPSVGGNLPTERVWAAALRAIEDNLAWIKRQVARTVQTNEAGRAAVLFPALLWLVAEYGRPIRLLELGASAGLNLRVDRYCYLVDGYTLGDVASPVRFVEPWTPPPPIDLATTSRALRISSRAGCDIAPLDVTNPEDRLTVLSYVWPDELDRIDRARRALEVAAEAPVRVTGQRAREWLPDALAGTLSGELAVVWHSLVRQYVELEEWEALLNAFRIASESGTRVAWLSMEPSCDHLARLELALMTNSDEPVRVLAHCGDHGPPVIWRHSRAGEDL